MAQPFCKDSAISHETVALLHGPAIRECTWGRELGATFREGAEGREECMGPQPLIRCMNIYPSIVLPSSHRQTDRGGYREPPELAEGGNEGRSGTWRREPHLEKGTTPGRTFVCCAAALEGPSLTVWIPTSHRPPDTVVAQLARSSQQQPCLIRSIDQYGGNTATAAAVHCCAVAGAGARPDVEPRRSSR